MRGKNEFREVIKMLKDVENKKLLDEQTNDVSGGCPRPRPEPDMIPPKEPVLIDLPLPEDPDPIKAPPFNSVRKIL